MFWCSGQYSVFLFDGKDFFFATTAGPETVTMNHGVEKNEERAC